MVNIELKRISITVAAVLFAITGLMLGFTEYLQRQPPSATNAEVTPELISLSGPITDATTEASGMSWYGDWLVILPQYPERDGVYLLPKDSLLTSINSDDAAPLIPELINFESQGLPRQIPGFEGYEAIVFVEDRVYLTIEAGSRGSYLVQGMIDLTEQQITLDAESLTEIPQPATISNRAHEALVVLDGEIIAFYENNDESVEEPVAARYSLDLEPLDALPMAQLPYRLTDATASDTEGRVWVMNYLFPGDAQKTPDTDPLTVVYGEGASHAQSPHVERIVALDIDGDRVRLVDQPPLQLVLIEDPRNWEGIVRLDDRGFLVVTDRFPGTLLAFVPLD